MPASKKPRKAYRKRAALMLPMTYALPESNRADLQVTPHMVLESFRLGSGTEVLWHTLAAAINIGSVLARACVRDIFPPGEGLTLTDEMQNASTRRQVRDAIGEVIRLVAE